MTQAVTLNTLQQLKAKGEKFTCVTSYDATFTQQLCIAGIETTLVGDSLGMVLQGRDSTIPVTIDEMVYHTGCVSRGNRSQDTRTLIIADLPFMAYATPETALMNASRLMQAGAHVVKLEGGKWLAETVYLLTERGIPVCCHLGLTPQSVHRFSGFRVQGKSPQRAAEIKDDARSIEEAGASLLVLECIPAPLASEICSELSLPTIGIGAGSVTDAQVLVLHDLLGLNPNPPRFVKNFMQGRDSIQAALKAYVQEVKAGTFPAAEHCFN